MASLHGPRIYPAKYFKVGPKVRQTQTRNSHGNTKHSELFGTRKPVIFKQKLDNSIRMKNTIHNKLRLYLPEACEQAEEVKMQSQDLYS